MKQLAIPQSNQKTVAKWSVIGCQQTTTKCTRKGYTAGVGKSVASQDWTEFAPPWL